MSFVSRCSLLYPGVCCNNKNRRLLLKLNIWQQRYIPPPSLLRLYITHRRGQWSLNPGMTVDSPNWVHQFCPMLLILSLKCDMFEKKAKTLVSSRQDNGCLDKKCACALWCFVVYTDVAGGNKARVITCATVRITHEDNNDVMMGNSDVDSYCDIPPLDGTCLTILRK